MTSTRFENIIGEFAPTFQILKPLALELPSTVFPIGDGELFTGAFEDHNTVYDGMIMAFNTAINGLENEAQTKA